MKQYLLNKSIKVLSQRYPHGILCKYVTIEDTVTQPDSKIVSFYYHPNFAITKSIPKYDLLDKMSNWEIKKGGSDPNIYCEWKKEFDILIRYKNRRN